ncbi:CHAT domain-containing protein [Anabaena cylindrica FACHB-243]|uniref:Tetratricopeptide TPR_2 repeat-containing protein n=1 Tax=Anabaena cylindrica (strain ATCC 27899 / PCC 7122) TaxID=272123 RepID=K9ZAM8_ANACC|nr:MULTISPECIES: CHAT domain-containing protein [Anabaena]AFZ55784.1 Tetratricopeptide TPR_2 repeat-containing protein [Anabaena cylindrica PCC 7122]MBD2420215.1 CHAT domain-containing protein [Anabaena cylindrica FACHB-243]MBY5283086.1 CHAT domain-containing protein [Anabaena sp. CCAP 1446/1C]MBY5307803.1 CHAT domain-containing protein [Anabaena sp. CCAP 1446/1C]MCM2406133.1 CHAT domain-containing protein [Anabaena sp. CCAP 1446/1C]
MAKKQQRFWRNVIAFLLCVLTGISLTLILEFRTVTAATVPPFSPSSPTVQAQELSNLIQQGRELYQTERYTEAVNIWQLALKAEKNQNNLSSQAMVLNYLSLAYQKLGQWQQAKKAITSSFQILGNFKQTTPQTELILAQTFNTQGSLELSQGQAEQALNTWQQATNIYTETGYIQGRIGSLINQAQAQQALGLYLQARKTLIDVEKTLENQPDRQLKTTGLRSLGNVLRLLGAFDDSRKILQQSLQLLQSADNLDKLEKSSTLLSLGNTAYAQGDKESALKYYAQAATTEPKNITEIQAQINQIYILIKTEKLVDVRNTWLQLQLNLAKLSPSRSTIYAHINLAKSLGKLGNQKNESAKLLVTALQQAKSINDQKAQSYALGYLGGLYEQTQQWSNAQELTEQALQLAQAINASEVSYQWQWQLGRILKAQGSIKAATDAYQVAFTTLKSLRSDLVAVNTDIQFSFRETVEPVYREYVELLLNAETNKEPSQEQLKQARKVIESLQLAELDNFFRSACLEGQIVPIEQIQQSQAAVIYPIILKDKLEVILSLPQQGLHHYTAQVSQIELEEVVEKLRFNLEKPYTTPEGKLLSLKVYDWLIRPVQTELAQSQVKTLVFILDGALRNIPMAALYDGKQYLLEKYSVALTPGLELLGPRPLRQSRLKTLVAGLTEARHGFSSLPNVNEELKAVESEVPSEVLLNKTFTSTALRQQIDSLPFSVVHLATHGQFSSNADETFVLAWDKPMKVNELKDLLRSREKTRPEPIELLVLSACETAEGDKRAALGLAGIAIQAGARSTLASLWSLDDESGALLIRQFYKELATKQVTKAEALRLAQLSLLKDPDYRHPVHWASYVLLGNWL